MANPFPRLPRKPIQFDGSLSHIESEAAVSEPRERVRDVEFKVHPAMAGSKFKVGGQRQLVVT